LYPAVNAIKSYHKVDLIKHIISCRWLKIVFSKFLKHADVKISLKL